MEDRTDLRRVGSVAAGRRGSPSVRRGRRRRATRSSRSAIGRDQHQPGLSPPKTPPFQVASFVVKNIRSSWRFGDDRDTKIDLARLTIAHPVEADQFPSCRIQADLQALDFAQPTVEFGFLNTILQIGDDLDQAGPRTGIQPKARTSYARLTEMILLGYLRSLRRGCSPRVFTRIGRRRSLGRVAGRFMGLGESAGSREARCRHAVVDGGWACGC